MRHAGTRASLDNVLLSFGDKTMNINICRTSSFVPLAVLGVCSVGRGGARCIRQGDFF